MLLYTKIKIENIVIYTKDIHINLICNNKSKGKLNIDQ